MDSEILVEVKSLVKHFPLTKGIVFTTQMGSVHAVDGVSFYIKKGETLGLVGESGCGKSTLGRLILRLIEPTSGQVYFEGRNILKLSREQMRTLRRDVQIIFQDPYGSLNPKMTVGDIIGEPLEVHRIATGTEKERKVLELLEIVGLKSVHAKKYPHTFSGGQRQRIGVARALALNPKFVICDEPVSSLDISIQAQVLNLLRDLQKEFRLTYLFISHDLRVIKHLSNRVAVMYVGKIVEMANKYEMYNSPQHPYTEALLSAIPIADPTAKKKQIILEGEVPNPINPVSGCRFHTRCRYSKQICKAEEPQFIDVGGNHFVACHLKKDLN
ncbi:MAG: ABC transporter ATP-binding protein [Candidatus Hodarchaeota archaeon]